MALATPSNISISRLYRVAGPDQRFYTMSGWQSFGPDTFTVYGNVSWDNDELGEHAVLLTVNGSEILLTRGATVAKDVELATYSVKDTGMTMLPLPDQPSLSVKTAVISVVLKSATETSSAASASLIVDGLTSGVFTGTLEASGNSLLLPEWTGTVNSFTSEDATNTPKNLAIQLASAFTPAITIVPRSASSVPMGGLIEGKTYRATFTQRGNADILVGTVQQPIGPSLRGRSITRTVKSWRFFYTITATSSIFFVAPAPVIPFKAESATVTALRNTLLRRKLEANYRATWVISSVDASALGGFSIEYSPSDYNVDVGPDEVYLVGTPTSLGSFSMVLTATRADAVETAAASISITVVDALPRTVITSNSAIVRDGIETSTADVVNISFQSTPSPATWNATGLPPGVSINQEGDITGRPTRPGTYFASVTASAENFSTSLPATIKFVVATADGVVVSDAASLRSTWLLLQWELTDLHIIARSREVQSTTFEEGGLRIKIGDAINFVILFVDSGNEVFALEPTQLRLTIRKANNLDDLIIFKSATPPASAEQEGQTYYLMPVTTGNREREVALEWAEENEKNEPLQCVADLDWIKDGKTYSSRTFPVLLELDVTRP